MLHKAQRRCLVLLDQGCLHPITIMKSPPLAVNAAVNAGLVYVGANEVGDIPLASASREDKAK